MLLVDTQDKIFWDDVKLKDHFADLRPAGDWIEHEVNMLSSFQGNTLPKDLCDCFVLT
jgi:hypothetical protein